MAIAEFGLLYLNLLSNVLSFTCTICRRSLILDDAPCYTATKVLLKLRKLLQMLAGRLVRRIFDQM